MLALSLAWIEFLFLVMVPALAWADFPIITTGREPGIAAMMRPYWGDRELSPGWRVDEMHV